MQTDTLAIQFPLTDHIQESHLKLSSAANDAINKFMQLSRDLSLHKLVVALHEILTVFEREIDDIANYRVVPSISKLQEEHERYFHITRYEQPVGDLMVKNILQSYLKFIQDCEQGSRLTAIDFGHIDCSLKSLMQYLLTRNGHARSAS